MFGARVALEFGDISKVPTHRARCRRRARRDGATATRAGSRGVRLEGRARRANRLGETREARTRLARGRCGRERMPVMIIVLILLVLIKRATRTRASSIARGV